MFAKQTEWNGIKMTRIGGWIDIAAYYAGSDGNVWAFQMRSFSNCGPIENFSKGGKLVNRRGELE